MVVVAVTLPLAAPDVTDEEVTTTTVVLADDTTADDTTADDTTADDTPGEDSAARETTVVLVVVEARLLAAPEDVRSAALALGQLC